MARSNVFPVRVPSALDFSINQPNGLTACGRTDIGQRRASNEDCFGVFPHLGLFMVADGMGGAAAGEVASRSVIEHVRSALDDADITWPRDVDLPGPESGPRRFIAGIRRANQRIHEMSRRDKRKTGMGTTFVGLLALAHGAVIAHVGDSRVYRMRGDTLERLTSDHSLANEYIRAGILRPEQVKKFPRRNVITRAVGIRDTVEIDTRITDVKPGDRFLLCSDGLHGELSDEQIEAILRAHADPCVAATRLVDAANDAGGSDNITAVLVRWDDLG